MKPFQYYTMRDFMLPPRSR